MALASAGDPLAYRHAVALYSPEVTYGTPVTPATAIGLCSVRSVMRNNNRYFSGPGSENYVAVKGGETRTEWDLRFPAVQTGSKTFLLKAQRSGGVVPPLTLGFGYQDDTPTTPLKSADQISGAKIGSLELGLDASSGHGPLTASMSGIGLPATTLTSLVPATLSTTPWDSYEGIFTRAGSAYPIRTFAMTLNNNLSADYIIPGASPGSNIRGPRYVTEHAAVIEGTISRYERSGVNIFADCPVGAAMVLVLTNLCDSVALTLTFAGVIFGDEEMSIDENGIFWSFSFRAKTLVMS